MAAAQEDLVSFICNNQKRIVQSHQEVVDARPFLDLEGRPLRNLHPQEHRKSSRSGDDLARRTASSVRRLHLVPGTQGLGRTATLLR